MKLFLLPTMVVFLSCGQEKSETIKPIVQNITESVYASGLVKSRNQYQVFSPVNGIISKQLVTEGDTVKKGQAIITLLNETPQLNVENAQLAASYSSIPYNLDRLNELKKNIELARDKMKNDSLLFRRQQNLWKEEIGSRHDLEQRELAWKNSTSNYQVALLQLKELEKQINFNAKQANKNLQVLNSINKDYTIRAIQEGKIYSILKQPGEMVNSQTPIAIIGDVDKFYMELQVDEFDISKIKLGQEVFVSMDSYKGQVFGATLTKILPLMDDRSRSFEVEAEFNTVPPHLFPNLTVEANILVSTQKNAITIPRTYLINEDSVIMKNGKRKKVKTGLRDYQRVQIIEGLGQEDLIKKPPK